MQRTSCAFVRSAAVGATLVASALLVGCADAPPTAPLVASPSAAVRLPDPGARGITVMTRNLYLGGDILSLAQPSPLPIPVRTAQLWAQIQASDFPERAGAIAREIAEADPLLVGLQEVPVYRIDPTGDAAFGGTTPATVVALDFLATLQDSLAALGLDYRVAAVQELTDVELPVLTSFGPPPTFIDVRYTDREVILARGDVPTGDAESGVYDARLSMTISGITISALRGWVSVEATWGGVAFRFVSTHLETDGAAPVQEAQARELLAVLGDEALPAILVGDFNSEADRSSTDTYAILVDEGGFHDVWPEAHRKDPGYTSPLPSSLFGPANLHQRIDLIFVRQPAKASPAAGIVGGVHADVVGEEPGDRTASGRWPSDHAGVVAIIRLPKGQPNVARR
ncbi:MAG TPA: endonuclease/exonuclease/phosphatase family protein [Gemmatimonadales bacterium]